MNDFGQSDIGDYYDNKRKQAEQLALELEKAIQNKSYEKILELKKALELARYVGD